jgi:hypothetical protein
VCIRYLHLLAKKVENYAFFTGKIAISLVAFRLSGEQAVIWLLINI